MAQAKIGDIVKVHYTGKLEDETVFDTSKEHEPLEFTIGKGQLIPDFENAVIGMNPGDKKTVQIPSERAYGPHRDEMVMEVARQEFPEGLDPKIDQMLQVCQADGEAFVVKVIKVTDANITLDGNHPLAGKDLIFDIQLAKIA